MVYQGRGGCFGIDGPNLRDESFMNSECLVHLIDGPSRSGKTLFAHFLAEFYRMLQVACDIIDTNLEKPSFGLRYAPQHYKMIDNGINISSSHQITFDDQLIKTDLLYSQLGNNDAIVDVNNSGNLTRWLNQYSHLYPKNIRFVRWCLIPDSEYFHDLIENGFYKKDLNYSVILVPNDHFSNFDAFIDTRLPDNHHILDFSRLVLSNRDRQLWGDTITAKDMSGIASPAFQLSRTRFVIFQRKFYHRVLFSQLLFNSISLKRDGILRVDSIVF
jgi:hypothetical protein